MSYKVTELSGLAGILVGRHAVSRLGLKRREQEEFYSKCDLVLSPLEYKLHRLQPDGTLKEPEDRSQQASVILTQGRINDEGSDPQSRVRHSQ